MEVSLNWDLGSDNVSLDLFVKLDKVAYQFP